MASYATVADLQDYYDWREIGDLVSDSDEQISALDQVTSSPANLYNTRLVRFLSRASGEVESVVLRNGRYSVSDLTGLTGNNAELLRGIVCEFVMLYLHERKPLYKPQELEAWRKARIERLDLLGSGKNIFNLPLVVEAGLPEATGATTLQYQDLNLITDRVKGFPRRVLPGNR